jgi:hypothetical protein
VGGDEKKLVGEEVGEGYKEGGSHLPPLSLSPPTTRRDDSTLIPASLYRRLPLLCSAPVNSLEISFHPLRFFICFLLFYFL